MVRFPVLGALVRIVVEIGWPGTRSSGVVRTRAIDDLVNQAIRGGARQLVLLGAGFDSRAYRLPDLERVAIFEVDHPATQKAKQERLGTLAGSRLANVRFVPVNFEEDDLEAKLIAAGFNPEVPTIVVWEGVVSYLTGPAVCRNFALLARLLAAGSRLIFTYMDRAALDGSSAFPEAKRWKSWVRFSGEPFTFGFDPQTLAETLRSFGFVLTSDASTQQIARDYCEPMGRKERGSRAYRVAAAVRAGV